MNEWMNERMSVCWWKRNYGTTSDMTRKNSKIFARLSFCFSQHGFWPQRKRKNRCRSCYEPTAANSKKRPTYQIGKGNFGYFESTNIFETNWLVEPVSPPKPFGQIWVSIMSHGTQHRSKFPCSHARKKASSQLSSPTFVFLFLFIM